MTAHEQRRRLESWKQISGYLQRPVRTLQRWEAHEGLPVHRHVHQSLGNVYAYTDELDAWIAARQAAPLIAQRRPSRWWVYGSCFALTAALAVWAGFFFIRPPAPVWLLVTASENRSGEPLLDETVPFLIERDIANSNWIHVVPQLRVEDILHLMRRDVRGRVDESLGREICLRDGGIRLMVTSRVERAGAVYVLTASVIEASSARLLGAASEQAQSQADIALAVQRLTARVLSISGAKSGPGAPEPLQRVTTPSLRACQLYSRAYAEGLGGRWVAAAQLASEAVTDDPLFASAHLWLAYALRNQRKEEQEWKPHLLRALELMGQTTDRERQFIIASEKSLLEKYEDAIPAYQRMLASYPDDYWARNNLAVALAKAGRYEEARIERYRLADLLPRNPGAQHAAIDLALRAGDIRRARNFIDRGKQILAADSENHYQLARHVALYPLRELWLSGRLELISSEADKLHRIGKRVENGIAADAYETLGRFRDAERIFASSPSPFREYRLGSLAYLRDDAGYLQNLRDPFMSAEIVPGLLMFTGDWNAGQFETFLGRLVPPRMSPLRPFPLARMAALKGDTDAALRQMEWCRKNLVQWVPERLIVELTMSHVLEQRGQLEPALNVLEPVDTGPAHFEVFAYWHRLQYQRARLLRKLHRTQKAAEIETALRRDLRLADSDHPLLERLKQSNPEPLTIH
jgi:tetratricopeptide (TPR) repeat protein